MPRWGVPKEETAIRWMAFILVLTSAAAIAMGMMGYHNGNAQHAQAKRTDLLTADLAGMAGREGVMWTTEIASGARAGKHYHRGDNVAYVLEGSATYAAEGRPLSNGAAT